MTDRLAEILTADDRTLSLYPKAVAAINSLTPGFPSGGDSNSSEPSTIVERLATAAADGHPDLALTAQKDLDRFSANYLTTAERLTGLEASTRPQMERAVHTGLAMLREAHARNQPFIADDLRRMFHASVALGDLVQRWAKLATPSYAPANSDLGREDTTPTWCTSCARLPNHLNEPRAIGKTRCDWCASFHATHHQDPPLPLLDAKKNQGKRITQQMIAEALKDQHGGTRKRHHGRVSTV